MTTTRKVLVAVAVAVAASGIPWSMGRWTLHVWLFALQGQVQWSSLDPEGVEKDDKNYDDSLWASCSNLYKPTNLPSAVKLLYSNAEAVVIVKAFMFHWMTDMEYAFKR